MTQIKYDAHDRWAYDTEDVDRALHAFGVTLNRIIPQDHELIRRNINEHLLTINNHIGDLDDKLHDTESDMHDTEDERDHLDYLLTEQQNDIRRIINSIDPHLIDRLLDAEAAARHNRHSSITITAEDADAIVRIITAVDQLEIDTL